MEDKKVELGRQILLGKNKKHVAQIDMSDIHPDLVGTFVFHYPSLMEQIRIGTIKAQLLDGVPVESVDTATNVAAFMMATLRVVLDSAPEWFNLDTVDDLEVLSRVFNEYAQWRESFRKGTGESNHTGDSQ